MEITTNCLGQVWVKCVRDYYVGKLRTMKKDEFYLIHLSTAKMLQAQGFVEI